MLERVNLFLVESENPVSYNVLVFESEEEACQLYNDIWSSKGGRLLRLTLIELSYSKEDRSLVSAKSKVIPVDRPPDEFKAGFGYKLGSKGV